MIAFRGQLSCANCRRSPRHLCFFVRMFYGQVSEYYWWNAEGDRHSICQGEGCEQGDPLAPALFALGQHEALRRADAELHDGESLMAFLDDLYLILPGPARAREAMDVVTGAVEAHTDIAANLGKTRVFNFAGGPAPALVADLGPGVWRGDLPPSGRGFVALGTPIGTAEYTRAWGDERLAQEALLQQLPQLPDLQCAWLLLCYCAAPRANHALCTVPLALIAPYAAAHDAAVWGALQACLGEPAEDADCHARDIALLPAHLGGLVLHRPSAHPLLPIGLRKNTGF